MRDRYVTALLVIGLLVGCASAPTDSAARREAIGAYTAVIADTGTTLAALHRCSTCREGNPALAGLARHPALFVASELAITYTAIRLSEHQRKSGNRYWYVIPRITTTFHFIAAGANLRFVF